MCGLILAYFKSVVRKKNAFLPILQHDIGYVCFKLNIELNMGAQV